MANISSPFGEKVTRRAWNTEPQLSSFLANFAIPNSGSVTYYDGQAVGRNAAGALVQCDDTAKCEFIGFETDVIASSQPVASTDVLGSPNVQGYIDRPYAFVCLIAAAAAGDEGKKVFWLYNNQVAYSGTTYANFGGTVLGVIDSTHVLVLAPWCRGVYEGGDIAITSRAATGTVTLNKFNVNSVVLMPLTAGATTNLPQASTLSPGDKITLINTSANTSTPTIAPFSGDTINGTSSYTQSTTQYAVAVFRTDGVTSWYVEVPGPSGTVGATTFTGNVAVSSSTLVVTDNSAATFAVGQNGATTPAFLIDSSAATSLTGVSIASGGTGVAPILATIGETNVHLSIVPAGTGGVQITSHSASSFAVGRLGITTPGLVVDSSTSTCITGLKITAKGTGAGVTLAAVGEASNGAFSIDSQGSGQLNLNATATGTVSIGSSMTFVDAKNVILGSSTGTKVGTATTQKLGFYNATPVTQPAANTDTTTSAAGSTTTVFLNTTYTGGGTAAYTVGGVVAALKALGLLAT